MVISFSYFVDEHSGMHNFEIGTTYFVPCLEVGSTFLCSTSVYIYYSASQKMLIWFCSWKKNYKITPVVSRVLCSCDTWHLAGGDKEGFNSSANKLNT